jgi:hypothetical protein
VRRVRGRRVVMAAVLALLAGGVLATAIATRGDDGPPPPPRGLGEVRRDLGAPRVADGFAAVVQIDQSILPLSLVRSAALPDSTIRGRFWAIARDRWRLELQGTGQDWQLVRDGATLFAYDSASQRRFSIAASQVPDGLAAIGPTDVGPAEPVRVAGRGAYRVSYRPRGDDLLIGRIDISADAATGVPLEVAIWARGADSPAIRIHATSAGPANVPPERVRLDPPPTATEIPVGTLLALGQRSGQASVRGTGWERVLVLPGVDGLGALGQDADSGVGASLVTPLLTVLVSPGARPTTVIGALSADALRRRAR